jgi:hypothetical protein
MKNWGLKKISLQSASSQNDLLKPLIQGSYWRRKWLLEKRFQAKILDSWTWLLTLPCIPIFIFFIQNIIDSANVYINTNKIIFFGKMLSNWILCLKEYKTSATFNWLLQFDACWSYGKNNFNIIFWNLVHWLELRNTYIGSGTTF